MKPQANPRTVHMLKVEFSLAGRKALPDDRAPLTMFFHIGGTTGPGRDIQAFVTAK